MINCKKKARYQYLPDVKKFLCQFNYIRIQQSPIWDTTQLVMGTRSFIDQRIC